MQGERSSSIIVQAIATLIQFGIPGLVGALPLAILSLIFYGPDVAGDMWVLGAFLIGSWFPLRSLFGVYVLKTASMNYIPAHLNLPILILSAIPYIFMMPILWMMTFASLLLTIAVYALSGQNFGLTFLVIAGIQCLNLYRQAKSDGGQNNAGGMDIQFNVEDLPFDFDALQADGEDFAMDYDEEHDMIVLSPDSVKQTKKKKS